jgi:hypothetical protein
LVGWNLYRQISIGRTARGLDKRSVANPFTTVMVVSVSIDYGKRLLTRGFNPDCFLF